VRTVARLSEDQKSIRKEIWPVRLPLFSAVAFAKRDVGSEFALHGEIPLGGLGIAVIVDVGGVERELAEIGHRKDAETSAKNGLAVAERTIGKAETRLKILSVELAKAGGPGQLVGVFDGSARHVGGGTEDGDAAERHIGSGGRAARIGGIVGIGGVATVDAGEEAGARLITDGNDDAAIANVEGSEII
jgi:hypothetical protein